MSVKDYIVKKIDASTGKEYIKNNHYAGGSHNAPSPVYGLFDVGGGLIGVCMFSCPCSENVRSSIYGPERKNEVIELSRFHILDVTPKNTESYFLGKCLRLLKKDKPHITCVISFSDLTEGHTGVIYRATNFTYMGQSKSVKCYRDQSGRLRHARQNGVNIKKEQALAMGWTIEKRLPKNRYIKFI